MPKSLITGGCGFIGSHLTELLLEEGHEVVVLDNLSTGRLSNLSHVYAHKSLQIIEGDLGDISLLRKVVKDCDYIFHLAALADIVPSITQPLDYFVANVSGTINLLEAAKEVSIKKFVYSASSSCYGIPKSFPTSESSEISNQYPYAFTKWAGEQAALHWGKVYGLPMVSLRLFNVYGPRARTSGTYGAVFGVFLAQKLAGKPMTIVGDGTQTRDFTYVTDVARAFFLAAKSRIVNEIYNVGSNNTYSINHLVKLIGGEFVFIPKRPGEPDCTYANTDKIKRELDWSALIQFEQGVKNMMLNIDYWKDATVWDPLSIQDATKQWFKLLGDRGLTK